MSFRPALVAACAALQLLACAGAFAQAFPSKPLRLIVSAGTGSAPDLRARQVGAKLAEALGQPVVVDNRPGGNRIIAAEAGARAPADGHTLFMGSGTTQAFNPWLFLKLPYRADADFIPVTLISAGPPILAPNPRIPARNVAALVELARAKPGHYTYATSGRGTAGSLLMEHFKRTVGIDVLNVPYKATGAEIPDLIAGQITMGFNFWSILSPHVRSAKLQVLAVASARRLAVAPDLPTGTPAPVAARLQAEIARILRQGEIRDQLIESGAEVGGNSAEEFAAFVREDRERMGKAVRLAGLLPE